MAVTPEVLPENTVRVLDHGFVRLDAAMATDLSVVNAARVSFARRKDQMDDSDEGLIRFLMRERHGTPFEHNAFRFHIRCPIFVAREWFRHRIGCLTGDTVVTFVDANGATSPGRRKTIDELWTMWTLGERNGHALERVDRDAAEFLVGSGTSIRSTARLLRVGRRGVTSHLRGTHEYRDGRWRVRRMKLRVLNEATNEFGMGHISDVVDKGVQPVYLVRLADGKELTLTENHRVLTDRGWRTLREAVGLVGDGLAATMTREASLMVNGAVAHRDREWLRTRRAEGRSVAEIAAEAGCSYHTVRKWLARHGLSFEAGEAGRGRTPRNKSQARALGNLITVCDGCHREIHRTRDRELRFARRNSFRIGHVKDVPLRTRGWRLTAHAVRVVGLEYVGLRQTYDLCVDGPWHNFVANGIVVHNSFNEFSMRYAPATDEFYVPEPEDVRTQVGKPGSYSFEPVEPELAETAREALQDVYETAYAAYERLVEQGVARELARSVLPVGAYTEFYWTVNARALMNFVSLRAAETAQREIRRYAEACETFFASLMPVTHDAFVRNDRVAP